jgi:MFS family permease
MRRGAVLAQGYPMGPVSLVIGVLAACFLTGAIPALVPRLKPYLQQRLGIDPQRLDRIERMRFFLSWAIAMPLGGWLADLWNPKDVLVLGAGGVALTLSLFGVANTQQWIGAMSFLLGCATSLLAVATLVLVPAAFPDLVPAAAMNLAFVAVGIGSFAPQLTFARLERLFGFKNSLLILGLGALIPAGFVLFADLPARQTSDVVFYHDLRYWLLGLALVFYFPIESALDVWAEPFLNELGYRQRSGRMMLIGFWLAFLAARLALAFALGERNEMWLLMLCVLVSAVVLGNLVGAYGASAGALGFWLVGFAYGPLLPTFLGMLVEAFPANPGVVVGSLFAIAGIHDALFQPVFHHFTHTRPVRVSMRIPLIMTLLMLAPLLMIGLLR